MKCHWSRNIKDEKESLIDLVNTIFPFYIRYCANRGYNLTCVEWDRNIKHILFSGYLREETIRFCETEIEIIKKELEERNKNAQ